MPGPPPPPPPAKPGKISVYRAVYKYDAQHVSCIAMFNTTSLLPSPFTTDLSDFDF